MALIGLDTNILIRFITKDHAKQFAAIIQHMEAAPEGGYYYIGMITFCEVLWVLRSVYGYSKSQLMAFVEALMHSDDFVIEAHDLVKEAFDRYCTTKTGLADILIGLRNRKAGCATTLTFDQSASLLDEFTLLA